MSDKGLVSSLYKDHLQVNNINNNNNNNLILKTGKRFEQIIQTTNG